MEIERDGYSQTISDEERGYEGIVASGFGHPAMGFYQCLAGRTAIG
jgi:hypothetical protein